MGLAYLNAALGRNEQAFEYNQRHLQLDPLTLGSHHFTAITRAHARDVATALEYIQTAIEMRPRAVVPLLDGVFIAGCCGRMDLAEEWATRAITTGGRTSYEKLLHVRPSCSQARKPAAPLGLRWRRGG